MKKIIHVIPVADLMMHDASSDCPCHPLDKMDGRFLHHAKDCREKKERQGKTKKNSWIMVNEIVKT